LLNPVAKQYQVADLGLSSPWVLIRKSLGAREVMAKEEKRRASNRHQDDGPGLTGTLFILGIN
jgi:hypothetical protein